MWSSCVQHLLVKGTTDLEKRDALIDARYDPIHLRIRLRSLDITNLWPDDIDRRCRRLANDTALLQEGEHAPQDAPSLLFCSSRETPLRRSVPPFELKRRDASAVYDAVGV
jgi:hypothetical protein